MFNSFTCSYWCQTKIDCLGEAICSQEEGYLALIQFCGKVYENMKIWKGKLVREYENPMKCLNYLLI